jgi:hypothetical protein
MLDTMVLSQKFKLGTETGPLQHIVHTTELFRHKKCLTTPDARVNLSFEIYHNTMALG